MYLRATAVLGLLLGATGCAKMATASASPNIAVYDFEDDTLDDEAAFATAMDMESMEESRVSRRQRRRERSMDQDAGGAGLESMSPPGVAPGQAEPEPEPAVANDDDQDHGRYIVYTATMQVSVFNLEDAKLRAEALPEKYGGFVQNMSADYFVMRIPSAKLRPVMEELGGLGVVDNRTLDAADVTEEYLDIETRIEVLQATQTQMMELLTKARTVEEALKVRQALDEITMELEVLKGRLRRLSNLVSFSTLTLSLVERGPHMSTPSSNDPFPWVDELGVEATEWK